MKRIVIMMTLLAMVLGAGMASAADLMATGSWRIVGQWSDNLDMLEDNEGGAGGSSEEDFNVYQRIRTSFHFVANENLKAVLQIEVGTDAWGGPFAGGSNANTWQLQGDRVGIEVKSAYIEFVWPNTNVTFLAGLMPVGLPGGPAGNPFLDHDMAGLVMSTPLTDSISMLAGWVRPYNLAAAAGAGDVGHNDNGATTDDYFDAIFLALPMDFDGIALTPYLAYAYTGEDFFADLINAAAADNWLGGADGIVPGLLAQNGTIEDASLTDTGVDIWYGGLVFNMSMFDPINVAASFHYGNLDGPENHMDRSGWLFDLSIEYTGFDFVTPELFFAYSTGEDGNGTGDDAAGEEDGSERLPAIRSAYGPTSVWFTGFFTGDGFETYDSDNKFGFWTAGLFLKNISFLEGLTHQLNILYIAGTNDSEVGTAKGTGNGVAYTNTLTEDDSIWEFDLLTDYAIYDELTLRMVLGYLSVDMDDENWAELAGDISDEDVAVFQIGLRYDF